MANKIARGSSGQATITDTYKNGFPSSTPLWTIMGPVSVYEDYYTGTVSEPGWGLTFGGMVTLPVTAPEGLYDGHYYQRGATTFDDTQRLYEFEVVCLTVTLSISQGSSAPIPNTSPQQYKHTFVASAKANGGTSPITYSWSTNVGSFSPTPASGDSTVTIEVIDTSPNVSGISGTVSCSVSDSGSPPCSNSDSNNPDDAGPSLEGPFPGSQGDGPQTTGNNGGGGSGFIFWTSGGPGIGGGPGSGGGFRPGPGPGPSGGVGPPAAPPAPGVSPDPGGTRRPHGGSPDDTCSA